MSKLTDKRAKTIVEKMHELGYECTVNQVHKVREGETIENNAALAGNIIHELDAMEISHAHS
jgi:menaquinone-dependent protoporphyrinogen IX oxidase